VFYRGGSLLAQSKYVYPDSEALIGYLDSVHPGNNYPFRYTTQGNWRENGRNDLVAGDLHGNLFYYKNEPPFSLSNFVHSLYFDTLWTERDNPGSDTNTGILLFTARSYPVLPKAKGDKSDDLMFVGVGSGSKFGHYLIYRGGPEFGSHRITLDDCERIFGFPANITDGTKVVYCGNMTGSGDPVMLIAGASSDRYTEMFYFYPSITLMGVAERQRSKLS